MLPFEFLMVLKYSYYLVLAVFTKSNTIKKCKKEQNWTSATRLIGSQILLPSSRGEQCKD